MVVVVVVGGAGGVVVVVVVAVGGAGGVVVVVVVVVGGAGGVVVVGVVVGQLKYGLVQRGSVALPGDANVVAAANPHAARKAAAALARVRPRKLMPTHRTGAHGTHIAKPREASKLADPEVVAHRISET